MKSLRITTALAVSIAMTGCYGPFNLTKKIYKWNGEVGSKWVNEGVFLGLVILPVYAFSFLGDAIIFNSIEFWGGKNPVNAKETKSLQKGDQQAVLHYDRALRRLRVDGFDKGRHTATLVFEPSAGGMVARDESGKVLMTARTENGQVVLSDAGGRVVSRHNPSSLVELQSN